MFTNEYTMQTRLQLRKRRVSLACKAICETYTRARESSRYEKITLRTVYKLPQEAIAELAKALCAHHVIRCKQDRRHELIKFFTVQSGVVRLGVELSLSSS
eukprot:3937214-Rhodomonas_salina.1